MLFIYREEYYLKNKEPKPGTIEYETWQDEMGKVHGIAEVIIGKQRHGPTGTVRLHFEDTVTRFSNLAPDESLPVRFEGWSSSIIFLRHPGGGRGPFSSAPNPSGHCRVPAVAGMTTATSGRSPGPAPPA